MVRYSEIYLGKGDQGTWTVFFRYHKARKKVSEIYIIDTKRILSFLRLDRKKAETCIRLKEDQTRGPRHASLDDQVGHGENRRLHRLGGRVVENNNNRDHGQPAGDPAVPAILPPPPHWIRSMMSRSQQKQYWWHDRMQESSWSPLKWYDTVNQAWL